MNAIIVSLSIKLVEAIKKGVDIYLGELGLGVHEGDGGGELAHWVDVVGERVEHVLDVSWKTGTLGPLGGEGVGLLLGGNFASDQEPEK